MSFPPRHRRADVLALEDRGLALTMTALRVAYAAGGDGEVHTEPNVILLSAQLMWFSVSQIISLSLTVRMQWSVHDLAAI